MAVRLLIKAVGRNPRKDPTIIRTDGREFTIFKIADAPLAPVNSFLPEGFPANGDGPVDWETLSPDSREALVKALAGEKKDRTLSLLSDRLRARTEFVDEFVEVIA